MAGGATAVVILILSWVSTVCFALMLLPQIVLNYRRRSTEGLSLGLVVLWHISAILIFPYLLHTGQPVPLQLQWAIFNLASVATELQFHMYNNSPATNNVKPPSTHPAQHRHRCRLPALALLYLCGNALVIMALLYLFRVLQSSPPHTRWLVEAIGSTLGSVFLALGFFPQIWEMCRTKSSEGFSLGVTFFDMSGSSLSILVLFLQYGVRGVVPGAVVPYAVIVMLQCVVLVCATVLYPSANLRLCKLGGHGNSHAPTSPSPSPGLRDVVVVVEGGGEGKVVEMVSGGDAAP